MRILQVNTFETGGGAEAVALGLHDSYRKQGHDAWMAVGRRRGDNLPDGVRVIDPCLGGGVWRRRLMGLAARIETRFPFLPGAGTLRLLARPEGWASRLLGYEDFDFPATAHLAELAPQPPDIIQCHNLHGGYADPRRLSRLSGKSGLVLTLHDCWSFTGHCAHFFDCQKWRSGCGDCPDLTIPHAIAHDRTRANWRRKQEAFQAARPYVAVPSQWLADQVGKSLLAGALRELRVIPNGVNQVFFDETSQDAARAELGLPNDGTRILLFAANTTRQNIWKDFRTLNDALARLAAQPGMDKLLFVALGEAAPEECVGRTRLLFVPHESDPARVALYYLAADIYVHAARAETFSLTIAEAMAAGRPVVATGVGAVPERILALGHATTMPGQRRYGAAEATGMLTQPFDAQALSQAMAFLLGDESLRKQLGVNGRALALQHYRQELQAQAYLDWFEDIRKSRQEPTP